MNTARKAELLDIILTCVKNGETVLDAIAQCSKFGTERAEITDVLRRTIPSSSPIVSAVKYDELPGMTTPIRISWVTRARRRERLILVRTRFDPKP